MGMSQLQTIKIDGMSREETTVRSLTPPEGHEDERLESSAVGISRLDPRSGTRRVALCGRRGVRTAVPALARGRPRYTGRSEIAALVRQLLKLYPNFVFAPDDIHVLIETPEKAFAEYVAHARAAATGRMAHHLFTGYLVAEAGEIKLLRETFNPLAMAQAQLPNGVADIGPPGDEVHAF